MGTVIFNQDFQQVDVVLLQKKIEGKVLCIFGDSKNNIWLSKYGLHNRIEIIFDNDESKRGSRINGVPVDKPRYIENGVIVTVLADLAHVVPQIRNLGYEEFFFLCSEEFCKEYMEQEVKYYIECGMDFVWRNDGIKYVHVIPDQKFIVPLVYIIENGFEIKEHAFLIHSFNRGNRGDEYNVWSLYKRLNESYGNIAIVDGIFSYDSNIKRRLQAIDRHLVDAIKIIIHGECLSNYVFEYLLSYKETIKKRGVLIPWSGKFGYRESSNLFIKELLRFCNTIWLDSKSDIGRKVIKDAALKAKHYYYNGLNYVQPIKLPKKVNNVKPKVLVSHSCLFYNRIAEAISVISKFKGKIEVYCIGSYGEEEAVAEAERIGNGLFGSDFHIVKKYMTYEDYVSFLNEIDVAVYAMEVGAGNTTLQILGYTGTKMFFKPGTNTYIYAKAQGYCIYDYYSIPSISLEEFKKNDTWDINYEISKNNFSFKSKTAQWQELFSFKL